MKKEENVFRVEESMYLTMCCIIQRIPSKNRNCGVMHVIGEETEAGTCFTLHTPEARKTKIGKGSYLWYRATAETLLDYVNYHPSYRIEDEDNTYFLLRFEVWEDMKHIGD